MNFVEKGENRRSSETITRKNSQMGVGCRLAFSTYFFSGETMRRKHRPMRIDGRKKLKKWTRIPTAPPSKIFENKRKKRPKHKKRWEDTP